jgi:hypothetical protein
MEIRNVGDALHHILDAVGGRDLARLERDLPSENHFAVGPGFDCSPSAAAGALAGLRLYTPAPLS